MVRFDIDPPFNHSILSCCIDRSRKNNVSHALFVFEEY